MSAHLLLTLPIAFPAAGIALCALAWSRPDFQRIISLAASAGLLGSAIMLIVAVHDGTVLRPSSATGRPRSASRSSRTCSPPQWC